MVGVGHVDDLELRQQLQHDLDDLAKVAGVRRTIESDGGTAVPVVGDLSDPTSVQRAATEIIEFDLPIAGLLNKAGVPHTRATTNALGWDTTFATNHLGPFALTEALVPHLADGTNVVFSVRPSRVPGGGSR